MCETRLDKNDSGPILSASSGHPFKFYSGSSIEGNGGVGFLVDSTLTNSISLFQIISPRVALLHVNTKPFKLACIVCYAPHEAHTDEIKSTFYHDLDTALSHIPQNTLILIGGDFNAQLSNKLTLPQIKGPWSPKSVTTDNGFRLVDFADKHKLFIASTAFRHKLPHLYTWLSPNGHRSQIDHILISRRFRSSLRDVRSYWGYSIGSDHALVKTSLQLKLKVNRTKPNNCLKSSILEIPEYYDKFKSKLRNSLPSDNCSWDSLVKCLNSALKAITPRTLPTLPRHPWISNKTITLFNRRSHTRHGTRAHTQLNSLIKSSLGADHEAYTIQLANKMSRATSIGDIGTVYNTIKSLSKPSPTLTIKNKNNTLTSSHKEVAETFKEFFSHSLNFPDPSNFIKSPAAYQPAFNINTLPPTLDEIEAAVFSLNKNKAPGSDNIDARILKFSWPLIKLQIYKIIIDSWNTNFLPNELSLATIIPIHKKGDKAFCSNYRAISLLSSLYKVFEQIILKRIGKYLEATTSEEQAGCRSGRSCIDHIHTLRAIIDKHNQFKKPLVITFLDFKSAFDSVYRQALPILLKYRGIPQKIIDLIDMLYHDSQSVVRIGQQLSTPFETKSGVKQGSILSPVLFNCFIDYIMSSVRNDKDRDIDYVDDVTLINHNQNSAQCMIDRVIEVASSVGLTLNPLKCKSMFIHYPQPYQGLSINNQTIEIVDHFTYLGSVISANGCISHDINHRIQCAFNSFNKLRFRIFENKYLSIDTKLLVYQSSIRSVLTYGSATWPHTQTELYKLEVFDRNRLREILGISLIEHFANEKLYELAKLPPLRSLIRQTRLTWFGHICRMAPNRLPHRETFASVDESWTRFKGRCRNNFLGAIKNEAEKITGGPSVFGIKRWNDEWLHIITDLTNHRPQWRAIVRDITNTKL